MSVEVSAVTKFYGQQKALDNVSFSLSEGEIVGFLGPNGAGKSTMMKIITGFLPPSAGDVRIGGISISEGGPELRKKIGYLPENNPLYPEMYVKEYLSYVASLYKVQNKTKEIASIIELTGLGIEQKKKIGALSRGYRQRVGLAQALIHDPEILILDEATTGLDPNQIVEIRNLIKEAGKNKTVLLSTHIMQEVEAICDRILIIDKGVLKTDQAKGTIFASVKGDTQVIHIEFDRDPSQESLEQIPGVSKVIKLTSGGWLLEAIGSEDIRPTLFTFAVSGGFTVLSLSKKESTLEEVFRHFTGK